MATIERKGVFKYVDSSGNTVSLIPEIPTDTSLTVFGSPADAKAVGDALDVLDNKIANLDISDSGGDVTIRYDGDSDAVQVKNGEEWVNWKTVGLKYFDLNTFSENDFTITSSGDCSAQFVGLNPFYFILTPISANSATVIVLENQLLPGYKYLNLVGVVRLYTTATAAIVFVNELTGEIDYQWNSSEANQTEVGISQKIELPTLEGSYTIKIVIPAYYGYGNSYIKFHTFTMTNE